MAHSQVGRTSSRDSVTNLPAGSDGRGPGAPWSSQREPLYDALAADVAASVRHARQDAAWLAMADSQVWRTSSRDLDIAPPAEVLEARGAAARPRPQPVGQRSGGGQQAVTTLRTRPQDGCGRCVPPPLLERPQRHLLHAVRGKRICDLTLLRNKGHPTAAIVCSRPSLRIIRRRHARTQRSLTTHTLCARGQHFSHVVLYTRRSTASHAIPAAGCDLVPTGAPVLLP